MLCRTSFEHTNRLNFYYNYFLFTVCDYSTCIASTSLFSTSFFKCLVINIKWKKKLISGLSSFPQKITLIQGHCRCKKNFMHLKVRTHYCNVHKKSHNDINYTQKYPMLTCSCQSENLMTFQTALYCIIITLTFRIIH